MGASAFYSEVREALARLSVVGLKLSRQCY
jgi:hypothetical protein